jgi:hypothetical protein
MPVWETGGALVQLMYSVTGRKHTPNPAVP